MKKSLWVIPLISALTGILESTSIIVLFAILFAGGGEGSGSKVTEALKHFNISPGLGIALYVFLHASATFLQYIARILESKAVTRIEMEKRLMIMRDVARADWKALSSLDTGQVQALLANGVLAVRLGLGSLFILISDGLTLMMFLLVAVYTSPLPVIVSTLVGATYFFVYLRISRQIRANSDELPKEYRKLNRNYGNILRNLKLWKVSVKDEEIIKHLKGSLSNIQKIEVGAKHLQAKNRVLFFSFGGTFVALLASVSLVSGAEQGGNLAAVIVLFLRMSTKVFGLQTCFLNMLHNLPTIYNMQELRTSLLASTEVYTGKEVVHFERELEFRQVAFSYASDSEPIFQDLNLTVLPGEFVGIIGPSGIGKSTLLDMVCGLVRPDSGSVCVDGLKTTEIDMVQWRDSIGFLTQDAPLISGSFRENICWHQPFDAQRMAMALERSQIKEWVATFSKGLDTPVASGGIQFSGGQRQRIALARALYKGSRILLLDEPTSAVDKRSELAILKALLELRGSTTILLVTHNEGLLVSADRVYSIRNGQAEPVRISTLIQSGAA